MGEYEVHVHTKESRSTGAVFYLLLHEISHAELAEECMKRAGELYGSDYPEEVKERMKAELECVSSTESEALFLTLSNVFRKAGIAASEVLPSVCVGNSFVAYLLGINGGINPLKPHYRCICRKFSDFGKSEEAGNWCDLPKMKCPVCGRELVRDGYGLDRRFFYGASGDKKPYIRYGIAQKNLEQIRSAMENEVGIRDYVECGMEEVYSVWKDGGWLIKKSGPGESQSAIRKTDCEFVISSETLTDVYFPINDIAEQRAEMEERAEKCPDEVSFDDAQTLRAFQNGEGLELIRSKYGMPRFADSFKVNRFSDLVRMIALCQSDVAWNENIEGAIKSGKMSQNDFPCSRDELLDFLLRAGVDSQTAFQCTDRVRKGKGLLREQEEQLQSCGMPNWFIGLCKEVRYLAPAAESIAQAMMIWRLQYGRKHIPVEICGA